MHDEDDPFRITDDQASVLRETIEVGARIGGIAFGAALALSLWNTADASARLSMEAFGRALALVGGSSSWAEANTFISQGRAYTTLLIESRSIDDDHHLTVEGDALLGRVELPPHRPIADILAESRAGEAATQAESDRVWWVNQGDSYAWSRDHEMLWAPKIDRAGRPQAHWTGLTEPEIGTRCCTTAAEAFEPLER